MATLEDEIKDLKEKNNELAQKVQYWKMTAAQKDNEKLLLMKEINDLRLKLSRIRNIGEFQANKLDAALQEANEKAMLHLVNASAEVAKCVEIAKGYLRDRQELENQPPRWSSIGGTPNPEKSERVHRVPPTMISGQSIQPVVALSRTILNTSNPRATTRSPNAVPMHMLQDVYIPLTRIDVSEYPNQAVVANNSDNSGEELELEDDTIGSDEEVSDDQIPEEDDFETNRLEAVSEEEAEVEDTPETREDNDPMSTGQEHSANPLEGPSWLLDSTPARTKGQNHSGPRTSTATPKTNGTSASAGQAESSPAGAPAFSPTVRRRKRTSSPPALATPRQTHYSPRPNSSRRNSTSTRVLKVMVAKMSLDFSEGESSPPKRARSPPQHPLIAFDAPSPNGATDSRVIVLETRAPESDMEIPSEQSDRSASRCESREGRSRRDRRRTSETELDSRNVTRDSRDSQARSRLASADASRDSDSGSGGGGDSVCEGRTRRNRKAVTYKEKPLNRKMRR